MASTPLPRRHRPWVIAAVALGLVVLVLLAAALAGLSWVRTERGFEWALRHVPGLQFSGMSGRPDGGQFAAEQVQYQTDTLKVKVEKLTWRDLQWRWHPHAGAWLGVTLVEPRAQRVLVETLPSREPPASARGAPKDVRLPLELAVQGLAVQTLQLNALPPIEAIAADLHLGDDAGAVHRVQRLSARMAQRQADAQLTVRTQGDMALAGRLSVTSLPGAAQPLQASAELSGTLPRPRVQAKLDAGAGALLDANATLAPFDAWPLVALAAHARDLDLATLAPGLPGTRLTGNAVVEGDGRGQPLSVRVAMTNALPGPWSGQRLPVSELQTVVRGDPADLSKLDLASLEIKLQGARPAGHLQGSGRWQGSTLALDVGLADVDMLQLHEALAPVLLSGPLKLRLEGLPSPTAATPAAPSGLAATVHTDLRGTLRRRGAQPAQLVLDGQLLLPTDGSLHARELRATVSTGAARAQLDADVQRDRQGAWQGRTQGQLTRFDPTDWWAGPPDAKGWQRGPHVLNGQWKANFSVPPVAVAPSAASSRATSTPIPLPLRDRLLAVQADGSLSLHDSRLAGVPLRAEMSIKLASREAHVDADLHAGTTQAKAELAMGADATSDRAKLDLDAPSLASLTPLFELIPGAAAWAPRSGSLTAKASAAGAWPAVQTQGQVAASRIDGGTWRLGQAEARWSAEPRNPDAPLTLQLDATALARGEQRLDTLKATIDGTLHEHRIALLATSPLRPPAWTDAALSQGQAPPRGGRLSLQAAGRWQPARAGGGEWRADIAELRAAPAEGATPWALARQLQAALRFAPEGGLAQATLAPNSVELLGATLRWQQASYQAPSSGNAPPKLDVDAQLEPLAIAPWLARLQPHMGWGGDLRIGGHIKATSAQGFRADLALQREGGDLRITSAAGLRALGLSELRLAATARDGVWRIEESLKGSGVGELGGTQTLHTDAAAVVPDAAAGLDGRLALRVADLGVWSAWLPAGWRIGGRLQADATLGGRLGAPLSRGRVTGSALQVTNLLQGVQLTDGELALALDGERATLERLVFRGGDGTLHAEGRAQLGSTPQAQVQVTAERLLAMGRVDRRVVVSGGAGLRLGAESLALDGRFTVDQGRIDISQADAPKLDEDVTVVQVDSRAPLEKDDAPPGLLAHADVQLAVDLGQDLRLRGRGLDTLLKGRLRITTPDGVLAVKGTLRTDEGTYTAYGQNLSIDRGIITFDGDLATPRLDILATRPDIDIQVGVAVQGSAADPRIRLFSEPEMSEMDKLSWLLTGHEPQGMGRAETALLQRAALALLAGERGNPSGGTLKKLGIDQLSLARGDSGELSDTVVTLGKQLSKRWSVAYERGLNAATGSWQLIYRAARRFTLRAQSGDDSAVDVIWTWRWN